MRTPGRQPYPQTTHRKSRFHADDSPLSLDSLARVRAGDADAILFARVYRSTLSLLVDPVSFAAYLRYALSLIQGAAFISAYLLLPQCSVVWSI